MIFALKILAFVDRGSICCGSFSSVPSCAECAGHSIGRRGRFAELWCRFAIYARVPTAMKR